MTLDISQRGKAAIEVSGIFTGFAALIVLLRLYTRFFVVRCAGIEDYFITFAMLCSIGLTVCIGMQVKYGMGKHIETLKPPEMVNSLKAFWASLIVYYLSLGFTKSSILLQYLRVFPTKGFRIVCWTLMAVVVTYTVWTVFGSIFACIPIRAFWTKEKPANCIDQFAMWFTNAAINIATDFAIIILPMPVIRSLNLARRQKQALMIIFAIGGFVCVVSILRLQSLVAISNSDDPTYDNPPAATWSSVETNVGIICSCLPCLRPLMTRWLPGVVFSTRGHGASHNPYPDRNSHSRKSETAGTMLSNIESRLDSRRNSNSRDDRIQVVTEVHVRVEGNGRSGTGGNVQDENVGRSRDTSTEKLVREAA